MVDDASRSHATTQSIVGIAGRSVPSTLRRAFRVVLVAVSVILLTNFVAVVLIVVSFRPYVQRTNEAIRASQLAFTGMLDQETGLRGYILTGKRQFLQPYVLGQSEVQKGNIALGAAGISGAGPEIMKVQLAEQLWEATWASVAAGGTVGPKTSQTTLSAFLLAGKDLFDADRVQQASLDTILARQQDAANGDESDVLLASLALAGLLFVSLAVVMRRQRDVLAEAIVQPVNEVLARIDRITDGDLGAAKPIEGPVELQRVGAGLGAMAERLAATQVLVEQRERELAEYAGDLRTILQAAREVAGSFNLDYVLDAVASAAVAVTRLPRAIVWLYEDDLLVAKHDTGADNPRQPDLRAMESGHGRVGDAARFGRSVSSGETLQSCEETAIAVPMVVGGRIVGVIDAIGPSGSVIPSQRLQALETLATHAATAVEAAKLHTATERLSRTDALTQLANRRQLDADLRIEVERAARYGRPLALIMLDVDHYKEFNDAHGHQRGDEVLALLAGVLSDELRSTDTAYRYGGEEFCVLVREGTEDAAGLLAERIRLRIEQRMHAKVPGARLTASFGVAQLSSGMESSGLVARADTAMYGAKASGRNRVVVASENTQPRAQPDQPPRQGSPGPVEHAGGL